MCSINVNTSSSTLEFQNALKEAESKLRIFLAKWDPMKKYSVLVEFFIKYNTTSSLFNKSAFAN